MEPVELLSDKAIAQLQQMMDTPLEDQASGFEMALLEQLLQSGAQSLQEAGDDRKKCEIILFQVIKNAFVLGRNHNHQLL